MTTLSVGRLLLFVTSIGACGGSERGQPAGSGGARGATTLATGGAPTTATGGSGNGTGRAGAGGGDASTATNPPALAIPAREAVTRLAKLLWQAAPDASLLQIADGGTLKTPADVKKLALQMLQDARARVGVGAFYRSWLWLDDASRVQARAFGDLNPGGFIDDVSETLAKDPKLYPQWSSALYSDATRETETFAVSVTLDMNGSF